MKPINVASKLIVSKTVFILFHGEKYILAKRFINSNHVLTPPQIKLSNFLKNIYNMCTFTIQKQKRKTEPNMLTGQHAFAKYKHGINSII